MKAKSDGTIIEATSLELWRIYINEEYDREMSFVEFLIRCEKQGTTITDKEKLGCDF